MIFLLPKDGPVRDIEAVVNERLFLMGYTGAEVAYYCRAYEETIEWQDHMLYQAVRGACKKWI